MLSGARLGRRLIRRDRRSTAAHLIRRGGRRTIHAAASVRNTFHRGLHTGADRKEQHQQYYREATHASHRNRLAQAGQSRTILRRGHVQQERPTLPCRAGQSVTKFSAFRSVASNNMSIYVKSTANLTRMAETEPVPGSPIVLATTPFVIMGADREG